MLAEPARLPSRMRWTRALRVASSRLSWRRWARPPSRREDASHRISPGWADQRAW